MCEVFGVPNSSKYVLNSVRNELYGVKHLLKCANDMYKYPYILTYGQMHVSGYNTGQETRFMDSARKYARAILGVVVAVLVWQILAATNLVGFGVEPKVEDGKLGSVPVGTAIPMLEAALSFITGWAFFFFQRLGDGAIAGLRAIIGLDASAPISKTNLQAAADFNEDMKQLYSAIMAKRQQAVTVADQSVSDEIKRAIAEATAKVGEP